MLNVDLLHPALKILLRKILCRRFGHKRTSPLPRPETLGNLYRRIHVSAGARASEHAFAGRQFLHHAESLFVGDHHDLVANRAIKISRDEAIADAFHFVWTRLSSTQDRTLSLDRDGMHFRQP